MGTYGATVITYGAYMSPTPGDRSGNISVAKARLTGLCDLDLSIDVATALEPYITATVNSSTGIYPAAPTVNFYLDISSDIPSRGVIEVGNIVATEGAACGGAVIDSTPFSIYVADLVVDMETQSARDPHGGVVATVQNGVARWFRRFRTLAGADGENPGTKQIWPK